MKFFNRYVLSFGGLAILWTVLFYVSLFYLINQKQYVWIIAISIGYVLLMFLSGRYIGRQDPYNGFMGLNYHLTTYMICIGAAWIVHIKFYESSAAFSMTLFWTIGLLIHAYVWIRSRRTSIGGFDKKELFE